MRRLLLCSTAAFAIAVPDARAADTVIANGETRTLGSTTTGEAVLVGAGSSGTLNIAPGSLLTLDTAHASTAARIELGNGGDGLLNLTGGTIRFNIAASTSPASTAIGRIWVGGGLASSGGTGTVNMTNGLLEFVEADPDTLNFGGIAIGRGLGVTGAFNQSGGTVRFASTGAIDIGTQGGTGSYALSGNAALELGSGGGTIYVGSRTGTGNVVSTGALRVSDSARLTLTTGANSGGQLYVGDARSTGSITQNGAGSVVTLGLANPILFGGNVNNAGGANGGGTGSYALSAGTLNVLNVGGSQQLSFGAAAGGRGEFLLSGGTANIATNLSIGAVAGSTGLLRQTGGTLSLTGASRLYVGAGTGSYELLGGRLLLGGNATLYGGGNLIFGNATLGVQGSNLTLSDAATLAPSSTFTIDTQGLNASLSGVLSGSGGLTKAGAGTLTLSAADTFTGLTTISGGTLALSGAGSIAASAGLVDNGIFDISGTTLGASLASLSGSGRVEVGLRSLAVGTDNSSTAFSGTIANGGVNWDPSYGVFAKVGTGTLTIDGATISGGEAHVRGGSIAQTSGATRVDYLAVGTGRTSGVGNIGNLDVSGGNLTVGTTLQLGDFGGVGTVNQTGGTVVVDQLCGSSSHCAAVNIGNQGGTGSYNISGGSLNLLRASLALGRNTATNPAGSGTLNLSGTGLVDLTTGNFTVGNWLSVGVGIPRSTGLINQSGGTLRIRSGGTLYLSGSGNGVYNLLGGALEIGGTSLRANYGSGSGTYALNLGGGTIRTIGSALVAPINATLLAGTQSTIDSNALGTSWSGVLSGGGGLIKAGAGTLTLSAANSYTGPTTISGGTLALTGAGTIASSSGLVDNGVFDISGTTLGASIANLSGSGRVETGVRLLQVGTDNSDTAFSGTIVNGGLGWLPSYGRFQKLGTGTLTLSGATISGGESYVTGGAVAQTGGQTAINYLAVGSGRTSGVANVGALNVSGGSLTFGTGLQVGDFGGAGTVNQSGGAVVVQADCGDAARCALFNIGNQGGTGIYNISGGSLTLNSGSFGLGRNTSNNPASSGTLNLSGTGLVDLSAGFFTIGNWIVVNGNTQRGSGVINQTGGTFRIGSATNLYLSGSGNGTYNLLGGALEIGGTSLNANYNNNGGSYQLNLGGGTIRTSGTPLAASVNATLLAGTQSTIDSNGLGTTWSGLLLGDGALAKAGAGTLLLTATNSYSGGTSISAGTLQIGAGGTTGSIAGDVVNNATLAFNRSDAVTFGGVISGSGSVVKAGASTLTLTGANSYSGSTTISAGTLALSGGGRVTGSIVDEATFDISATTGPDVVVGGLSGSGGVTLGSRTLGLNAVGGIFSGNISGSGGLALASGTQILSGANSYTGGTIISGGTLQLGNGGTEGSILGNIVDNGTLAFNRADAVTFAQTISGSGALLKTGAGTLTLTAVNSFTGPTTIGTGTLALDGAGRLSGGVVANGIFDISATTGADVAIGGLSGSGGVALGARNLALNGAGGSFVGSIAGSGALTLLGGSQTLAGANSYSGGTTIAAGTLRLGAGGTTGSIVGDVTINGELVFDRSDDVSLNGVLTGSGSLTKVGASRLTLTAANSYTGGTTIAAGILALTGAGRITGDVVAIGGLVFDTPANLTFGGAVSGTGTLTQAGSGTLTLTGTNLYAGGTIISAGTLRLAAGGSILGNVVNGGTLAFDRTGVATFAGAISGTGSLLHSGSGTTILTANNSYAGGTTISSGMLRIGAGGTSGSIAGDIVDNSMLAFDRSDAITIAGKISGTGSVTQAGSGTLTLTGANSYSGGTTISAGTLRIAGGGSIPGNVANGGTLLFDRADSLSFGGTISGLGSLVKAGAGTLTLGTANSYGGGTVVQAGTLALTADRSAGTGRITLESGATLRYATGINVANDLRINGLASLVLASGVATQSGALSGSGRYILAGAGRLLLTGDNSGFTGLVSVSGLSLDLFSGAALGNGLVDLTGNTVFRYGDGITIANALAIAGGTTLSAVVDTDRRATQSGAIGGAGSLAKTGAGTLTLSGANSFSGGTTIAAGTLRVGDGGTSGAIAGDVVNGGTLTFDRTDALTFSGAISGGGALVKLGAGVLTLTGASSFTGGTTVRTGMLLLGNDRAAGLGRITLEGGTALGYTDGITVANDLLINGEAHLDVATGTATQAGAITGTGRYMLTGNGRLLLTGDNSSFSGPVSIAGVSLDLDSSNALGSGEVELLADATLSYDDGLEIANEVSVSAGATLAAVVSEGAAAVQAGAITGDGAVAKAGTGTMILTGNNDYTGGTTISGGVLQVGSGGTSGSITGNIDNSGTLAFNRSDTLVFTGAITGSGAVVLNSPGTIVLTGQNSYSGGTAIAGGTLALSGEGRISGPVVNNGVFDIGGATGGPVAIAGLTGQGTVSLGSQTLTLQGTNASFAGTITGAGAVTLTSGSQMLTGTNSHSGGTTIMGGTLIATAAALGTGPIVGNGALVIDQGADARLANPVSGSGTLTKSGTAKLELTGTSDFSGTTHVTGGRLAVNGMLPKSVVSADSGTTLSGAGTVGGVALANGAALAPGNSIGTLTVAGNVVQAAGSIYEVEVDPASERSDRIVAQGSATIAPGAILHVIKETNTAYVPGRRYTVMTAAGGVTGSYTVTGDTAISGFYALVGRYAPQSVTLEAAQVRAFSAAGVTLNQIAAAEGLDSLAPGNRVHDVVAMYSDDALARAAFDQLSGEIDASMRTALTEGSRFSREAVLDEVRAASCGISVGDAQGSRCDNGGRVAWGRIFGSSANVGDTSDTAALDFSARGIVAGVDVGAGEQGRAGVYAGASRSRFSVDARASTGESENRELGVYAGGRWGGLGLALGAGYAWHDIDTTRIVVITGFADRLSRTEKARTLQAFGEVGYRLGSGATGVEPFAGLAYVDLDTKRSSENGGDAALDGLGSSTRSMLSTLGLRVGWMEDQPGSPIGLAASLAWRRAYGSLVATSELAFAGGDSFTVAGAPLSRDAALVEVGVHTRITPSLTWNLDYSGQLGPDIQDHGLRGTLSWRF